MLAKEGRFTRKSHDEFVNEILEKFNGNISVLGKYEGSTEITEFSCKEHGVFLSKPHVILQSKYGCNDCFRKHHKNINSKGKRYCCVCGSDIKVQEYRKSGKNYCNKHFSQMSKYGEIKEKTIFDRNEIIEYDDFAEIVLLNRNLKEVGRASISLNKVGKVKEYKWYLMSTGYVATRTYGKHILLHRFILDANEDERVDHKNRIRNDCRNSNLRKCNSSENAMNTSKSKRNTSGVTGVWFDKRRNKWVAEIFANGKKHSLGRSKDKDEAIKLRKDAEIRYFGEFAPQVGDFNG